MKPQLDPRPDEADKPLWEDPQLLDRLRALEKLNQPKEVEPITESLGYVTNMISSMVQKQKLTDGQPCNWATKCGWKWAGKRNVHSLFSFPEDTKYLKWKKCPKCFNLRRADEKLGSDCDSSASSSNESSTSSSR
jgi:hypothetical protein